MPSHIGNQKKDGAHTVDSEEIRHFAQQSDHWWDDHGPFAPLHRLNPARLRFIKEALCTHFSRDPDDLSALSGLTLIDVGCGGGLTCEPMARLGANVTGIDADTNALSVARAHAQQASLAIAYTNTDLGAIDQTYDVVLALEVIEHVTDIHLFMEQCARRLNPGGLLILSTLNRTVKSYVLGIAAAEYILGWVPKGTHSWNKFVKPSELAFYARQNDLSPQKMQGLVFHPLRNSFILSDTDTDVNYLMAFSHSNTQSNTL